MKIDESISGLNIMIFVCLNSIRYFYCCYMIADCCRTRAYACNSSMLSFNLNNMSKDISEFMQEAIRLSINNVEEGKGGPFGAVVVKDGKIIARGVNQVTTTNDPTAHAEVVAIRNACKALNKFQLDDCEIYTSCEPCPMCLGAIYWARPAKLFYANSKEDATAINFDDQFIYEEIAKPISERKLFTKQILREEALEAFKKWSESTIKREY